MTLTNLGSGSASTTIVRFITRLRSSSVAIALTGVPADNHYVGGFRALVVLDDIEHNDISLIGEMMFTQRNSRTVEEKIRNTASANKPMPAYLVEPYHSADVL